MSRWNVRCKNLGVPLEFKTQKHRRHLRAHGAQAGKLGLRERARQLGVRRLHTILWVRQGTSASSTSPDEKQEGSVRRLEQDLVALLPHASMSVTKEASL